MCFEFSLQLFSETFLILKRNERDMIKQMYIALHVKYRLFFSCFNITWNFLSRFFRKNPQISDLKKIRPVEAELFHADGQTGRQDDANSRPSQFC